MRTITMFLIIQFLLMFTSDFISAQHRIVLKSGEEMNGKIKSLIDDQIQFEFKGNDLKFSTNEVVSIFFSESSNSTSTKMVNENGIINGVVTYFFNDNYGDKPDVGAKITLHKTTKENSSVKQFDNFSMAKTLMLSLQYLKKNDPKRAEYTTQLKEYGISTEEDFKAFDKQTAMKMLDITSVDFKNIKTVTVDGNGTYSVQLSPGFYEVIFQSKGRNGLTMTEVRGKIKVEEIEIKSNEKYTIDCRFDRY